MFAHYIASQKIWIGQLDEAGESRGRKGKVPFTSSAGRVHSALFIPLPLGTGTGRAAAVGVGTEGELLVQELM